MAYAERARVFVQYRRGGTIHADLLDLAALQGQPIAVVTWMAKCGRRVPAEYIELDPARVRASAAPGTYWYDGIAGPHPRADEVWQH